MKQGIIVVNHGTTDLETRQRTIEDFMLSIKDRFEDADVIAAYTDGDVRKRLREETGEKVQNLKAAMLSMKENGVQSLAIVTTDILEDEEHKLIREEARGIAGFFNEVGISKPLISEPIDAELTARAFGSVFGELVGDGILIVVAKDEKTIYSDAEPDIFSSEPSFPKPLEVLEEKLKTHIPESYVASLRGSRRLYKVIKELAGRVPEAGKRVVLVPMEFVAGEEIENELSNEYNGLVQRLIDEGYDVEPVFRGLGEYDDFQRLYMRHLYEIIR
ncbi:MAG: sirohydrochlorin cobaltochelatase [Eubacterium sp.]|nr:sirohydrochlorin cobaltochelatase [Eubacterium sp.]